MRIRDRYFDALKAWDPNGTKKLVRVRIMVRANDIVKRHDELSGGLKS